jgi:FHA domain
MSSPTIMPRRTRKRWVVAVGLAVGWLVLMYLTGSFIGGTALLLLLAVLAVCCVISLRSMGIRADHPWVRQLATRPWRDGQDVLRVATRHLPDVFVTTPSGTLLAPNAVELRLNPRDLASLADTMDIGLICESATEVYVDQVAGHGARFTGSGPAEVRVVGDPAVPEGRFVVRQGRPLPPGAAPDQHFAAQRGAVQPVAAGHFAGQPVAAGHFAGQPVAAQPAGPGAGFRFGHDGGTRTEATLTPAGPGTPTVTERRPPAIPLLRLVTGDQVAETRTPGARAGRGAVELVLPQVPTISREHARFTFADGQWWVTNLGRNGLTLNGTAVAGDYPVQDGDSIRWGGKPDALASRVEIG